MKILNVQFSDSSETTIIAYFSCPQDATRYPNQGLIENTDQRWAAYYQLMPDFVHKILASPTE